MIRSILPLARWLKHTYLYRRAKLKSGFGSVTADDGAPPFAFIVGCGRSGTTILGDLLAHHAEVAYLFEPTYYWAAIDDFLDVTHFFSVAPAHMIVDANACSEGSRYRFHRLFDGHYDASTQKVMVEKTPHNAMRIGYLEKLSPHAKYIHIVRDGGDVIRSIQQLSTENSYKVAFKPAFNQWWGEDECKWEILKQNGKANGYFAEEVDRLEGYQQKAAYEWLVSIGEVKRWQGRLGDRLLVVNYGQLVTQPHETLSAICEHLGIALDQEWITQCASRLVAPKNGGASKRELMLPTQMCEAFNGYQQQLGFVSRAVSSG